jgi:16S rRNA (cytidine1402-2'-O)-methyltransferase
MAGTLYVIATPLGNLDDLSPRAAELLATVDRIACEDTRRTSRLLARHRITTAMVSCHKHNEQDRIEQLLGLISDGSDIALVSDGGTPAISDPGAYLVDQAHSRGLKVVPVPGPSAVTTLLSAAGLPADRYIFDGFLPHRGGERRRRLRELSREPRTLVLFETPHRILDTLADMDSILGDRLIVLGRELTKVHEQILRGTAAELGAALNSSAVKGEFCLAIAGAGKDDPDASGDLDELVASFRKAMEEHDDDRRAALRSLARSTGRKRADLYRSLVEAGELD